jgi:xanthine dehydrogenase YagS FAD-binding subunit
VTSFPKSVAEASSLVGEFRAGGTDVQERRRSGTSTGLLIDLNKLPSQGIVDNDNRLVIGAQTTISSVANSAIVKAGWPALARTARGLATPQIRAIASIGGNLTQRTRCAYFRHPALHCFKSGGSACPAREGDHAFGVVIDQGPCVAPHPSSLGAALLIYDALVEINGSETRPIAELWGDGTDPTRDHLLAPGEIITSVLMPTALEGERGGYFRAISRFEAEWPLVEAVVRFTTTSAGAINEIGVAVGGVANTPLRLPEVEAALVGLIPTAPNVAMAARQSLVRCQPLRDTGYKVELLLAVLTEAFADAQH